MKKNIFSLVVIITLIASGVNARAQLKTEAVNAQVSSVIAEETKDQLVIKGVVSRGKPIYLTLGAHVHVQLIGAQSQVITNQIQYLSPTAPKRDVSLGYRSFYSVELPLAKVAGTKKVRVEYVANSHDECIAAGKQKKSA